MVKFARGWLAAALLCGCVGGEPTGSATASSGNRQCVDRDEDGFGDACAPGPDCNDHDPAIHEACLHCALPEVGCACDPGTAAQSCFLEPTDGAEGTVMCHEGTRYCRGGTWSACESIHSYPRPESSGTTSLLDPDAGPVRCNSCLINCFRINDNLDPVDGGLDEAGVAVDWVAGGGLTLGIRPPSDAGPAGEPPVDPALCVLGVGLDLDCDGIPNAYDPYPDDPPFATANPAIFLDIPPGSTGTGVIDLEFYLNSADVYFLIDQSGSMAAERDKLKLDLTAGNFLPNPSYECADYDFDHQPNNELREEGIVGAIRCMIRDANFGTGFFREIPFSTYANSDHIAWENYQDITSDINAVLAAIGRLTTIGNLEWPEASMLALHSVLTGQGMYFGTTKRGVLPRTDCPELTWGYPCFRDGAVPIVVLFTDAQFHNGPNNNDFAYDPAYLGLTAGTGSQYYPLPSTNEDFGTVADLGDVTSNYKTYAGDTSTMAADLPPGALSCLADSGAADAMFQFSLTQQRSVTIESTGTRFDTVLGLYAGPLTAPTDLPPSSNTNETATTAFDLGPVFGQSLRISGNTAAMLSEYAGSDVACSAAHASPEAFYRFSLSTPTNVAVDATSTAFDPILALYSGAPPVVPAATAVASSNEAYATAYPVGDLYNRYLAFSGNTGTMASDYSAAQVGCNADSGANDAVYAFTLSAPTRVRISTEGSSYDTVLALNDPAGDPAVSASVSATNDRESSAYAIGTLDDRAVLLTGNTVSLTANYTNASVGCNANSNSKDGVFSFHLDATTDVQIDSIGTTWDSVLALYNGPFDPQITQTTNNANEAYASAHDLGTVNGADFWVTGGNTSTMNADYDDVDDPCAFAATGEDAVYKFRVSSPTRVAIDTDGSSFNTTLALYSLAPTEPTSGVSGNALLASAHALGSVNGTSVLRTGSTASLGADYNIGCTANTSSPDSVFSFMVGTTTEVVIDTVSSSLDTVIGLYPSTIVPAFTTDVIAGGGATRTTAYDIGTIDGTGRTVTGDTSAANADWSDLQCGADDGAEDSFIRFTVGTARNVTISTVGSSYDTVVTLYRYTNVGLTTWSLETCAQTEPEGETLSRDLVAGTYFVVVKGDRSNDEGNYTVTIRDSAVTPNLITCDDDSAGSGDSRITRTLDPGSYHVVVGGGTSSSGTYQIRFRDNSWWNSFGYQTCNDDSVDDDSLIERDLAAGDYWFMVKGRYHNSEGNYKLRVRDVTSPPSGPPALACDDDGGGGVQARINQSGLAAGDYYVVLKGDADGDSGPYTVRIQDTSTSENGAVLQCDDDTLADAGAALIERDLAAGSYRVVVKGDAATDEGAYKLTLRDITHVPDSRVACNDGTGNVSSISQSLAAGTYYVAVKGNDPTSSGAYTLAVRDDVNSPATSPYCNDNGSTYNTSKITTTLNAGTYYVALKGKTDTAEGKYQLSIGAGTTASSSYGPPTWSQTLAAVQSTGVHVIPILSCHDDPDYGDAAGDCVQARSQATTLANASNALGPNLEPLVFDIDGDGTGLSNTVVSGVADLAQYLEMDVKVRVLFDPDANPGFGVSVVAVDEAGDGCSGLIGLEHQNCLPGATPRFQIAFTNPLSNPVLPNPNDPMGGYSFRAELIGDDQFIVDQVPIYIIPLDVDGDEGPPAPDYYEMGSYEQTTGAGGCGGNDQPDWRDLSWVADVPENTAITFKACTAPTVAGLASCVPNTIATVTGAGTCMTSADCAFGYCDQDLGVCQLARSGACVDDSACTYNAVCDTSVGLCTADRLPIYVGRALGEDNFDPYLRMVIELSGQEPFDQPPVLYSWELTYECNSML